ncbi:MAG: hypothetical protein QOI63_1125 [Thermoplasmata archaeon]|jgi:hypothetical protein|nr:hypothetical protein [Thermoplasmata archaeon]
MSFEAAPCRPLGEYVTLLVETLRGADPPRFRRLRDGVGGRRALIAVDREAVVVSFAGDDLRIEIPGPGVGWDGAGWTTRAAVLEMLDGYLEVGAAVAAGRLDLLGAPQDVTAMFHAIEVLLDATPRVPALVAVAKAYRLDPCLAPRTQPPAQSPCGPRYPFSPSLAEEGMLRRLGLLGGDAAQAARGHDGYVGEASRRNDP